MKLVHSVRILVGSLAVLVGSTGFAASMAPGPGPAIKLEQGAKSLQVMNLGSIKTSVRSESEAKCPPGSHCVPTAYLVVEGALTGCADDAAFGYQVILQNDGTYDVFVSALQIANVKSESIKCTVAPVAKTEIHLGLEVNGPITAKDVRVHFAKGLQKSL